MKTNGRQQTTSFTVFAKTNQNEQTTLPPPTNSDGEVREVETILYVKCFEQRNLFLQVMYKGSA